MATHSGGSDDRQPTPDQTDGQSKPYWTDAPPGDEDKSLDDTGFDADPEIEDTGFEADPELEDPAPK